MARQIVVKCKIMKKLILNEEDLLDIFACEYGCKIEEVDREEIVRDDMDGGNLNAVSIAFSIEECLGTAFNYDCHGRSIGEIIDYVLNLDANKVKDGI